MPSDAFLDSPTTLPPLVLRPPLGPRVLRGLVMALAAIFHAVTAGWNLISNGREGDLAGAARVLVRNHHLLPLGAESAPGPLTVWLAKASMNYFGVNEFAARLPTALAVLLAVWFTLRLGERFGGTWRGFVAGMLLLCTPGMFTLGRILTPAPLSTALVVMSFYFLVRGFEHRPDRRQWFFLAWIAVALTYFAGGWRAVAVPVASLAVLTAFFREARMRFPALLSWEGGLVLLAAIAGAWVCGAPAGHGVAEGWAGISNPTHWGLWGVLGWQMGLLFPWSLLLIPAANTVLVRLAGLRPLDWAEAFPLVWIAVALTLALLPGGSLSDTLLLWPAFALWGALRFEITPRLRFLRAIGGVFAVAIVGLVLTSRLKPVLARAFPTRGDLIHGIPGFLWPSVTSVAFIAVLAFALFTAAAFWLELHHHRRFAVLAFFGAMIPAGYAFADASAKFAPYFSYADIAHCIGGSHDAGLRVVVDGNRFGASSLRFYLDQPFQPAESPAAVRASLEPLWNGPGRVFLITRRARLGDWKPVLGERVRISCESGGNLLLTNTTETDAP